MRLPVLLLVILAPGVTPDAQVNRGSFVWERVGIVDLSEGRTPFPEFADVDSPTLKGGESPAEEGLAPVQPNPTTGAAQAPLTLLAPAHVRAVIYDALGREVALLHDTDFAEGTHVLDIQPDRWAPGVYVLSVEVSETGTSPRRYLHHFTLAR